MRITSNFSETMQTRRECSEILKKSIKRVKKISHHFRFLGGKYPSKVNEKYFLKQKLRAFVALQKKKNGFFKKYLFIWLCQEGLSYSTRDLCCVTRDLSLWLERLAWLPCCAWDPSFLTRDQPCIPHTARWIPNHREVPQTMLFKNSLEKENNKVQKPTFT